MSSMREDCGAVRFIHLESVPSTNAYAFRLGEQGEKEIVIVRAEEQTHGQGRRGRSWNSAKNAGVYLSFLLRPQKTIPQVNFLSLMLAFACVRTLEEYVPARIKWPNDVIVNGKKIAGVLLQASTQGNVPAFVVAGAGLNTNADSSLIPPEATSLLLQTGKTHDNEKIFTRLSKEAIMLYGQFKKDGGGLLRAGVESIVETIGKEITVRMPAGSFTARATGIDECGNLIIEDKRGGKRPLTAAEVTRIR